MVTGPAILRRYQYSVSRVWTAIGAQTNVQVKTAIRLPRSKPTNISKGTTENVSEDKTTIILYQTNLSDSELENKIDQINADKTISITGQSNVK